MDPSDMHLDGRIAMVTGAASGIGAATVLRLISLGARVVTLDVVRPEQTGELWTHCDLIDAQQVSRAFAEAEAEIGPVTALVNAAGIAPPFADLESLADDMWDRVFAINAKAVFLCTRAVVPQMVRSGGGSIVNVSSVAGSVLTSTSNAAYTASK